MFSLLANLKIRTKLLLMLVFPVAGLLYFSIYGIQTKAGVAGEMEAVEGLARLAVSASALVHETQKERGMTAAFLGSSGRDFITELPGQRQLTDTRAAELKALLSEAKDVTLSHHVRAQLDAALRDLDRINDVRSGVTALKIRSADAIGYYTEMNAKLLDMVSGLTGLTNDGLMVRRISAYVNFLQGKERAGIERAVLANAFAGDRFSPGQFNRFSALISAQDTYIRIFKSLADEGAVRFYEEKMRNTFVEEATRLRELAFEKSNEGQFGVDATHWFKQQTGKIDLLKEVEDRLADQLIRSAEEGHALAQAQFLWFIALTVTAIGVAALLAYLMVKGITDALRTALVAMIDIAEGEGDLTRRLDASAKDEIGQLADAFNRFADKIQGMLISIKEAVKSIDVSTSEIAAGNLNLSQRTEEQASSLEETASSMEEMTATVKQNANNAGQANQLAEGARTQAEKGGDVVQRAVGAMREINDSSKKIADIIAVIDEIAFQTNLLALNAAVEAARAGEQGRGFAVVAGEVRNLAQRSAEAAKEIKELIEDSVGKVGNGSALVEESGKTLGEIVVAVKKVTDIVSEIAAASQEQASGIDQVNKAVMQMDEVTQQNAALVEEAAAASKSMEEQSRALMEQIAFFRLGDEEDTVHNAPQKRVPAARKAENRPAERSAAETRKRAQPPRRPSPARTEEDGEWEEF